MSHDHPYISLIALEAIDRDRPHPFKEKSHEPYELAKLVCRFADLSTRQFNPRQRRALQFFRENVPRRFSTATDFEYLSDMFKTFDSLFFFGALNNHCVFKMNPRGESSIDGITTFQDGKIHIELIKEGASGKAERLHDKTGTLLHEMCHAFLLRYACIEGECNSNIRQFGITGHGFAWAKMTHGVQKGTKLYLGFGLDASICQSLAIEMSVTGKKLSDSELLAVGVDSDKAWFLMANFGEMWRGHYDRIRER